MAVVPETLTAMAALVGGVAALISALRSTVAFGRCYGGGDRRER